MANTILKNGNLITDTTVINLRNNDKILATYEDTGAKNQFMFIDLDIGGTIRVIGGASDVFTLQSNVAGEWADLLSSSGGKINDVTIFGKTSGFRLNITTNTSTDIKLEMLL